MLRLVILLVCAAAPVLAQDWSIRPEDRILSREEVKTLTDGRTLVFYDDGQSMFSVGGAYSYTYANGGGTAFGQYTISDDGTVCIQYRNGRARCDRYVESRGRIVMLTARGERYPLRP